jgi:hypothetical protein
VHHCTIDSLVQAITKPKNPKIAGHQLAPRQQFLHSAHTQRRLAALPATETNPPASGSVANHLHCGSCAMTAGSDDSQSDGKIKSVTGDSFKAMSPAVENITEQSMVNEVSED